MASANVYSPDYDAQGNPKDSIPELKDAIENAVVDAENFASATGSFTDDNGNTFQKGAKGWAADAQTAANTAEAAKDASYLEYDRYETKTQNHIDRVSNDGGVVLAPGYLNEIIKEAVSKGFYSSLYLVSPLTGVKLTNGNEVSKLYNVGGDNIDPTPSSSTQRPTIDDWPAGGRLGLKFDDDTSDEMISPEGSATNGSGMITGLVFQPLENNAFDIPFYINKNDKNFIGLGGRNQDQVRGSFIDNQNNSYSAETDPEAEPLTLHLALATANPSASEVTIDITRGGSASASLSGGLQTANTRWNLGAERYTGWIGAAYAVNKDPDNVDVSTLREIIEGRYASALDDLPGGVARRKEVERYAGNTYPNLAGYDPDVQTHFRRVHRDGGVVYKPNLLDRVVRKAKSLGIYADGPFVAAGWGVKLNDDGTVAKAYDASPTQNDFVHVGTTNTTTITKKNGLYFFDFEVDDSHLEQQQTYECDVSTFFFSSANEIRSYPNSQNTPVQSSANSPFQVTERGNVASILLDNSHEAFKRLHLTSGRSDGVDRRAYLNSRNGLRKDAVSGTVTHKMGLGRNIKNDAEPFDGLVHHLIMGAGTITKSERFDFEQMLSTKLDIDFSAKDPLENGRKHKRAEMDGWIGDALWNPTTETTVVACLTVGGAIKVFEIDNQTGETINVNVVRENYLQDTHAKPTIIRRASDNKYVLAYGAHGDQQDLEVQISDNADDITSFGSIITAYTGAHTYPKLVQLPDESNKIYLFFRARDVPSSNENDRVFQTSTDGGQTWSSIQRYFSYQNRPYVNAVGSKNGSRIDFLGRGEETGSDLWHFYYEGGNWYKTDGTLIGGNAALPLSPSDVTHVLTSSDLPDGVTVSDGIWRFPNGTKVIYDSDGDPVGAVQLKDGSRGRFKMYFRWNSNASTWESHVVETPATGEKIEIYDEETVYSASSRNGSDSLFRGKRFGTNWTWEEIDRGREDGFTGLERPFTLPAGRGDNIGSLIPVLWHEKYERFPAFDTYQPDIFRLYGRGK